MSAEDLLMNTKPTGRLRALAAALCLAFSAPLLAQTTPAPTAKPGPGPLPRELPPFARDAAFPTPQVKQHTLANGLQVWVVPRQGIPRVNAVLAVRGAGSAADAADQPGFAALLARLLTEGTAQRDARALAELAQGLGGDIAAAATNDGLSVTALALPSKAEALLRLLAEVVRQPAFPAAEVELVKSNALEQLKASSAEPGYVADGVLSRALYAGHPYGNTQPTETAIRAVTSAQLKAAHERRVRPEQGLLIITGRIDPAQALAWAEAAFGDWRGVGEALVEPGPARTSGPAQRLMVERGGSVQTTLRLGRPAIPVGHPDADALQLASGVLGAGFNSRVNLNLREEKGYTYGAGVNWRSGRIGGAITAGADVRNEVTGAALKEFEAEFKRMVNEPVPAQELAEVKRYLAGSFAVGLETQAAVASTLARNWLVGRGPAYLGEVVPRIQRVTAAQVQAAARQYYDPAQMSLVVVGDPAVRAQLQPWGAFTAPPAR